MDMKVVNLYQHFGVTAPEYASCTLICYKIPTPESVSRRRKKPGVLILPGGGYGHTSLREGETVALRFAARGYVPFVLHYSVAPCRFPTSFREAAMAMRYIRDRAAEFEVNPGMVAAVGFSAGGHLCGTLGTLWDSPEVADVGSADLLRPNALGLCYPVAVSWGVTHEGSFRNLCGDDPQLRQRLSLDRRVRPDMPPVYLWHTRDDGSVPVRNSLILAQALEEAGVDFAMRIYRHGCHGLSTADEMVYPACCVPEHSPQIGNWPEEMMGFFAEIGFRITDNGEENG
jgi:acetyl esterase/lipase